jgi:uncharacterized protein YbjT (DUF2867 family)
MILIAGGGGRLGSLLVADYAQLGLPVRVLVRNPAAYRPPAASIPQVEVAGGDVADPAAVDRAVAGVDVVVSAVHGMVGTARDSIRATDVHGNRNLVEAALRHGVRHFVLMSAHGASPTHPMELMRAKFEAEEQLRQSRLAHTIIRPTTYLETWLELVAAGGRGTHRPRVLGRGVNPINFVAATDVAALVVNASRSETGESSLYEIGGPDNLSMSDVARRLIDAGICTGTPQRIPRAALRVAAVVTRPVNPVAARLARSAYLMDTVPMTADQGDARTRVPGVPLTRADDVVGALGDV